MIDQVEGRRNIPRTGMCKQKANLQRNVGVTVASVEIVVAKDGASISHAFTAILLYLFHEVFDRIACLGHVVPSLVYGVFGVLVLIHLLC